MSILQSIRLYFGISNASLANYLGTSIDMMQSISNGRRRWTFDHWLAITKLYQALDLEKPLELPENSHDFWAREKQEAAQLVTEAIIRFERDLTHKREQLSKSDHTRNILFCGLSACESLLSSDLSPHQRKWVETRQRHLRGKFKENSLYKSLMLETEINSLETRLNRLKSFDRS